MRKTEKYRRKDEIDGYRSMSGPREGVPGANPAAGYNTHEFEREEGLTWSRQGEHREGRYLIICKPVCHVGSLPWHKIDTNMVGDEAVQYVFCC